MENTIATFLEDDHSFATFMSLIKFSGLYTKLNSANPITVFSLPNKAFEKLGGQGFSRLINESRSKLQRIMAYHIVEGSFKESNFTHGQRIQTMNGNDIVISHKDGKTKVNESVITKSDMILKNGVVHVLDSML